MEEEKNEKIRLEELQKKKDLEILLKKLQEEEMLKEKENEELLLRQRRFHQNLIDDSGEHSAQEWEKTWKL